VISQITSGCLLPVQGFITPLLLAAFAAGCFDVYPRGLTTNTFRLHNAGHANNYSPRTRFPRPVTRCVRQQQQNVSPCPVKEAVEEAEFNRYC